MIMLVFNTKTGIKSLSQWNRFIYFPNTFQVTVKAPKLNKLNDGHFKKAKQKVKNQVEDIADDLIKLYSERSQLKGFAFSADDEDQHAFDDAFPYVETDDQLRSVEEIKRDMQASQPMDRLLVGDVGFGKTESCYACSL